MRVHSYFRSSSTLQPSSGVKARGLPTAPTLSGQVAQTFKGVSSVKVTIALPADTGEGSAGVEGAVQLTEYEVEVCASSAACALLQTWRLNIALRSIL